MKKVIKCVTAAVAAVGAILVVIFLVKYFKRLQSITSIEKLTDHDDYNLYSVDIKYGYDTQNIIDRGISDTQSFVEALMKEAIPYLPVNIKVPDFGCSVFTAEDKNGTVRMGRNYDFKFDTSALMVHCNPENGYESIAFCALDNLQANDPTESIRTRLAVLASPFVCLDGINEKGLSIAVLTLDSKPTKQDTGKEKIATSLAIRLVLDNAASTKEAVEILKSYDMIATGGRDYHFYITDASGDGRIVEYDCESEEREIKVTKTAAATNFYELYKDKVLPDQKNGIYGHGKERYDRITEILDKNSGNVTEENAWEALNAASQEPNPLDVTSNTQWSVVFNNMERKADIVIRRHWGEVDSFKL